MIYLGSPLIILHVCCITLVSACFFVIMYLTFHPMMMIHLILFFAGLSFLISSSINEDRYGVVQKDLPTIIATLFTLQKVNHEMSLSKNVSDSLFSFFFCRPQISTKESRSRRKRTARKHVISSSNKSSGPSSNRPFTELFPLLAITWIRCPLATSGTRKLIITNCSKKDK